MSRSWVSATIADCLVPVSVRGKSKIQTRDYQTTGRFPVIDQGQLQIAGWTDNENAVIDEPLPLIVFGDHTRAFKFVNRPFARGADGTQLLRPKPTINPQFFFYACRAIDLPARGYNRHFTLLKEQEIAYPVDASEQQTIAAALRQMDSAIMLQSTIIDVLAELGAACRRELLTRGLLGEIQKDSEIGMVPESWQVEPLEMSITRPEYGYTSSAQADPVGPKFLRITDIQDGCVNWDSVPYCDIDADTLAAKRLEAGDIVVARIGATTGKAFLIDQSPLAVFASYMIRIRTDATRLDPSYLYHFMQSDTYWQHIDRHKGDRLKGGVNIPVLNELPIARPSPKEQSEIVTILDTIDRKAAFHRRKRKVLDELFASVLHKLMGGEISVDDLDLSALHTTEEALA